MILADWIVIAVVAGCLLFGSLIGFGRGLKFFTSGIFGFIISVFLCYCFGGIILKLQFVQDMLNNFSTLWADKEGFFFDFLTKVHIEIVVYYIVLFIVAQIVRIVLVKCLKHIVEAKFFVAKIINKVLGAALFAGMGALIGLVALQIIYWIGGGTAENLMNSLNGSFFKLDLLFLNNPLLGLVESVKDVFQIQ